MGHVDQAQFSEQLTHAERKWFFCCNNPIIRIHNFKFEEIKIERLLSQTIITLKLCKVEVPNSQRLVVIMQYKLERQLW